MHNLFFNFYGLHLQLKLPDSSLDELPVLNDFKYFEIPASGQANQICISISRSLEPQKQIKGIALFNTTMGQARLISFVKKQMIYIKNKNVVALATDIDRPSERVINILFDNLEVLNEILYYIVMSVVGEYLDVQGYMRLHAASFSNGQQTVLVWGHSKAGKSTLTYSFFGSEAVKIYSDEMSLFDLKSGRLLPFPTRVSTSASKENRNVFFHQKEKLDIPLQRRATASEVQKIFTLKSSVENKVEPLVGVDLALFYFHVLIGTGLIQMIEYFLRPTSFIKLVRILINRIRLIFQIRNISKLQLNRNQNLSESLPFLKQSVFSIESDN